MSGLEDDRFARGNLDDVVAGYESLLVSIAASTDRLAVSVAKEAAAQCFGRSPDSAAHFAQRLAGDFGHCRRKLRSFSSGAKLTGPVRAVVRAMQNRSTPKKSSGSGSFSSPPSASGEVAGLPLVCGLPADDSQSEREFAPEPPLKRRAVPLSPSAIYAMYGGKPKHVSAPLQSSPKTPQPVMEIHSSQDVLSSQEAVGVVATPAQKPEAQPSSSASVTSWVDHDPPMRLVRANADGTREAAVLQVGESGFAFAQFGTERIETVVPNLLLGLVSSGGKPENKSAHKFDRRRRFGKTPPETKPTELNGAGLSLVPAQPSGGEAEGKIPPNATTAEREEREQPLPKELAEATSARGYLKMWYKNESAYGIRQKFGAKRQIFRLGGRRCALSEEELTSLANDALAKLHAGEAEEVVKAWAQARAKASA